MDFSLSLAKHDLYFRVYIVKCRMIVHPPLYSCWDQPLWLLQLLNPKLIYMGQQKNGLQFPRPQVPHRQGCLYEEWARHGGCATQEDE